MTIADEIVAKAKALCQLFIAKVEGGRAVSIETYAQCKELLALIEEYEKNG